MPRNPSEVALGRKAWHNAIVVARGGIIGE